MYESLVKHGHARIGKKTPEYSVWHSMIGRCECKSRAQYKDYGGRGISVCTRWRRDFSAFLADMGPRPPGTSIDRIDNDGNYEPGNCRWATTAEQAKNKRPKKPGRAGYWRASLTDVAVLEIRASVESVTVLAKRYGISRSFVSRIKNNQRRNGRLGAT